MKLNTYVSWLAAYLWLSAVFRQASKINIKQH